MLGSAPSFRYQPGLLAKLGEAAVVTSVGKILSLPSGMPLAALRFGLRLSSRGHSSIGTNEVVALEHGVAKSQAAPNAQQARMHPVMSQST